MRRILLQCVLLLLGMVALPSYGQIDPDEVFTIFEWDFADGQGDFTTRFDWDEMGHWGQEPPTVQPWQYDAENGWMVSSVISSEYMSWYLYVPIIDFTDKGYYDTKLSFEYAIEGDVYVPNSSYSWECGSNYVSISCGSKGSSYKIPNIVYNAYQRYFTTAEIDLDEYVGGGNLRIQFDQNQQANNHWYIKKVKVTGKHKYGKQPFTLVRSVSELKELPSNTPVKYINPNLVILAERRPAFVRDETGAMALTEGVGQWMGSLMNDTIYALYTRENGYTELKYVSYNWNYDADSRGFTPKEITEDEYADNECDLVTMTFSRTIFIDDEWFEYYHYSSYQPTSYTPHNPVNKVTGFVIPKADVQLNMVTCPEWQLYIELSEDGNNVITNVDKNCGIGYRINRRFEKDKWYTLTIPGTYQTSQYSPDCYIGEFVSSNDGILEFQRVYNMEAGKPYLVKFNKDREYFGGTITLNSATAQSISGGDYNFVGTLNPVQPVDGSYYLSANNTIKPLASGGTIKAFHAYFEPASPNAAKARAISIDGMTTAIEDIVGGEELLGLPKKIYTVGGQYVGDDLNALPKGVYLVNGKKIIK